MMRAKTKNRVRVEVSISSKGGTSISLKQMCSELNNQYLAFRDEQTRKLVDKGLNKWQRQGKSTSAWLASRKTTDALFLRPGKISDGLALDHMPLASAQKSGPRKVDYLGARAAALSATNLTVKRARLELDIDASEFDILSRDIFQAGWVNYPPCKLLTFS